MSILGLITKKRFLRIEHGLSCLRQDEIYFARNSELKWSRNSDAKEPKNLKKLENTACLSQHMVECAVSELNIPCARFG